MLNRKVLLRRIALLLFCCLIAASVYSQEDVTTVHDSAFEKRERPAVKFVHDEHNNKAGIDDCIVCHHVYEEGELTEYDSTDSECSECHLADESQTKDDLMQAYHTRCKNCHLEKKSGPIMCGECHIKGLID